jgi:hypothetical protein
VAEAAAEAAREAAAAAVATGGARVDVLGAAEADPAAGSSKVIFWRLGWSRGVGDLARLAACAVLVPPSTAGGERGRTCMQ